MLSNDVMTLRTRFIAEWQTGVNVVFDNQPLKTVNKTLPFARLIVRPSVELRSGFSTDMQLGRVIVSIFVPRGNGTQVAYDYADTAAAIFRKWSSSDHKLRCASPTTTADDSDPDWFRVDVSTPWQSQRP